MNVGPGGSVASVVLTEPVAISAREFAWIQAFILQQAGIDLKEGKEVLVASRLERRLRHHKLETFTEYIQLLNGPQGSHETRIAVDLLTTNETYFFREPKHFTRLPALLPAVDRLAGRPIRIWSAAGSTGEEAYSIALTLAGYLGDQPWEIVGTDISTRVLETARRALYPIDAADHIPDRLLRAYCLKGRGEQVGYLTLQAWLRSRVTFEYANLTGSLPSLGKFDAVFLRNVMIYFGQETKRELLERVVAMIRPGGHLFIGHAESISGLITGLELVAPAIYRVPGT